MAPPKRTISPSASPSASSTDSVMTTDTAALPGLGCFTVVPEGTKWLACPSSPATSEATSHNVPILTAKLLNAVPASTKTSKGVSGGVVAGVAVACFLAGAAIAALVCFLLYRRQNRRPPTVYAQQPLPYENVEPGKEKGAIVMASLTQANVASNMDNLLPQPVEDDAITREISRIRDNIKNHARSYYHFEPVQAAQINSAPLVGLATATGMSTSALAELFANPSTRGEAIRIFVAWVAMSRCEGSKLPTFLPEELASLAVVVSEDNGQNAAHSTLFSKWKTITGALLQPRYGKQGQKSSEQSQGVGAAITELDSVLASFVKDSNDGGQRRRNLEMTLSRAANLAFLLFSQPGSFRFDFSGQSGGLVVFPALLQVIGDQSELLRPPKLLWEKELVEADI